jgi:xanthine dehydrogenase accessory factor
MSEAAERLSAFLAANPRVVAIHVAQALGSTPREEGAWMLVGATGMLGTIGGGQMEYQAIERAQRILAGEAAEGAMEIPLGPEIGQCCGGRVTLDLRLLDEVGRRELTDRERGLAASLPQVVVFGAGHVGKALAEALSLLPLRVTVVETREGILSALPATVTKRLMAVPEEAVREASPGSAFVVLTHDHALDFLIVAEALRRGDTAYVGMIGSATKLETFKRWWLKEASGDSEALSRLTCPIGGTTADKRPAVVAALTAAEMITVLTRYKSAATTAQVSPQG